MRRAHSQDQRDTGCRPRRNGSTRHGPGLSESAMPRIWIQLRGHRGNSGRSHTSSRAEAAERSGTPQHAGKRHGMSAGLVWRLFRRHRNGSAGTKAWIVTRIARWQQARRCSARLRIAPATDPTIACSISIPGSARSGTHAERCAPHRGNPAAAPRDGSHPAGDRRQLPDTAE